MYELQPRVVAQHGRHHRDREVLGERRVREGPQDVREPQDAHRDVRPSAREAPHVALDLGGVLGEAARREGFRLGGLGEDGRVPGGAAVDAGTGLHHEPSYRRRLLAGPEELHGADDVRFLDGAVRAARSRTASGDRKMDHRVHGVLGQHSGDRRLSDVRTDELRRSEPVRRCHRVHRDHPLDVRVTLDPAHEAAAQLPGSPSDEYDLPHELSASLEEVPRLHRSPSTRMVEGLRRTRTAAVYFLLRRWTRVRLSSLRCFFLAIRLRRFLITEPTTTLAHFSSLVRGVWAHTTYVGLAYPPEL